MIADLHDGKLALLAENDLEQRKLFDFLEILIRSGKPLDTGLLEVGQPPTQKTGIYLRVMIDNFDQYMRNIIERMEHEIKSS